VGGHPDVAVTRGGRPAHIVDGGFQHFAG
jgi:hypothetical protein